MNDFDRFWTAYPKKRSKGDARKAFNKLNPDSDLMERILQAIDTAKRTDDWQKTHQGIKGQFIPYPATWLRAEGWEDEHDIKLTEQGSIYDNQSTSFKRIEQPTTTDKSQIQGLRQSRHCGVTR
jgi:hypothetical protein